MSESNVEPNHSRYWRKNITLVLTLLVIWFTVSLGSGILFRGWLDDHFPKIGNAPFGFWMAQQGSIICFVLLLVVYKVMMDRLENAEGYGSSKSK